MSEPVTTRSLCLLLAAAVIIGLTGQAFGYATWAGEACLIAAGLALAGFFFTIRNGKTGK